MPTRPPSPCSTPGCPLRVPCPDHAPKPWAGAKQRRPETSGRGWATLRTAVLTRDGHRCYLCGGLADQVDHVTAHAEGGTTTLANLRAVCRACHGPKTQAEAQRGRQRSRQRRSGPI